MNLEITVAPASEPLTTAEGKKQCEIETSVTAHDTFIDTLIKDARVYTENYLGIGLFTQTVVQRWGEFPQITRNDQYGALDLSGGKIQSVTHVKYIDSDGATQTLTVTTDYKLALVAYQPKIVPAYSKSWPGTRSEIDAVWCEYVRGWATTAAIPNVIKRAMLLMVNTWFECRNDTVKRFPTAANLLLDQYKMHEF